MTDSKRGNLLAGTALLALAVFAVYANSFHGPFVFDDPFSTIDNPTLRQWSTAFFPPHRQGFTVEGRPILNASLALNWAISGPKVWSYHLFNLIIHLAGTLTLFAILRRTMGFAAGLVAALLWAVHPLQTESVTYMVQRAESLMGLFYFLTIYSFLRYASPTGSTGSGSGTLHAFQSPIGDNERKPGRLRRSDPVGQNSPASTPTGWAIFGVFFCCLGMATKEDMVSAPLIVLLLDRAFLSGSFRTAWRRHGRVHLALFSTWLVLAFLMLGTGSRGRTSGFGSGISVLQYWPTQPIAILHYLRLAFWPAPLVFDYGTQWIDGLTPAIVPTLFLLICFGAAIYGLAKNRRWAVPALFFFALLAPNSVIVGNRQTSTEHRMYLPLAAVIILTVASVEYLARRRNRTAACLTGLGLLALPLGIAAAVRNRDYRSERALYLDTVQKLPSNAFARYNYGKLLYDAGELQPALREYQAALHDDPGMMLAEDNLGNTLRDLGRFTEAEAAYRSALKLDPNAQKAHYNLGLVLLQLGRTAEAADQFNAAVLLKSTDVDARDNLGGALLELRRLKEAEAQLLVVLQLSKGSIETHLNLGTVYLLEGRSSAARAQFKICLKMQPGYPPAQQRLAQLALP